MSNPGFYYFGLMKYLLAFLLCPLLSFSQSKKDTKIIVSLSDTNSIVNRVSTAFHERGYSLENKEGDFVSTKEKSIKAGFPTAVKLRAFLSGNTLTFTGEYKVDVAVMGQPPTWDQISFTGFKGSAAKLSWEEMDKIARNFGTVSYSK
jgi:hypothetical protein